jgi:hypothetical protein
MFPSMGHYLSGDLQYGQLRRFNRFPLMAQLLECGEMLMVPRFEWHNAEDIDDSDPFLESADRAALPAWLVPAAANAEWLRVPSQIEPVWFAKQAAAALRAVVKTSRKGRRGRLKLALPFAFLLRRADSARAFTRLNQLLTRANAPIIPSEMPAGYDAEALWPWHQQHFPAQLQALEQRDPEGSYLTLLFALTALLNSELESVFICDDEGAVELSDFVKRRFSRLNGSKSSARSRLEELVGNIFTALKKLENAEAERDVGYALSYVSDLAEASELAAQAYVASARLKAESDLEQARCDLAWADHLAGGRYQGPYAAEVERLR